MLRTIYGDDERYRQTYWSRFPGRYFAGDGAKLDDDGYWWILGRVDDVLNVAGHRIGTMEVESALVDHPAVAEAAVVGRAHELKGQALAAFVTLKEGNQLSPSSRMTQGLCGQEDRRRSHGRTRFSSPPTYPRPGAARSCAGSSRTSPRGGPGRHYHPGRSRRGEPPEGDVRGQGRLELNLGPELHHAIGWQAEEGRGRLGIPGHDDEQLLAPARHDRSG